MTRNEKNSVNFPKTEIFAKPCRSPPGIIRIDSSKIEILSFFILGVAKA